MALLGLYILTCEHRTTEGIFRLPREYMAADLPGSWPASRLDASLDALLAQDFLRYDFKACVVLLPNAMKYQRPDTSQQQKAAVRNVRNLPKTPLLADFFEAADRFAKPFAQALTQALPQALTQAKALGPLRARARVSPALAPAPATAQRAEELMCTADAEHDHDEVLEGEEVDPPDPTDAGFDAFYGTYPRKQAKLQARRAWRRLTSAERDLAAGVATVMAELVSHGQQDRQFVPMPSSFLNGKRWEDWRDGIPPGWGNDGQDRYNEQQASIMRGIGLALGEGEPCS